jgi:hypothetical protein
LNEFEIENRRQLVNHVETQTAFASPKLNDGRPTDAAAIGQSLSAQPAPFDRCSQFVCD